MPSSEKKIKLIRNTIIQGLICEFTSLILFNFNEALLTSLPNNFKGIVSTGIIIIFVYGYIICWKASYQYGKYKGYPSYLGLIAGLTNIFGLSLLFLLDSKQDNHVEEVSQHPLKKFSITEIFIAYITISALFFPLSAIAISLVTNTSFEEVLNHFSNADISAILTIPLIAIITLYFFRKLRQAQINLAAILGSLAQIDLILPITIAIAQYLFVWGFNSVTLYYLSFALPSYVEAQINQPQPVTVIGWITYSIAALVYAPIMEEIFFRGIIFQKIGINTNILQGLFVSSILFAIIHFRFDFISLFLGGILLAILYFKTKQLTTAIFCHFCYNFIVISSSIYSQFFFSANDPVSKTIVEYRQQFIASLNLKILLIVISLPYLIYFIYRNFPRTNNVEKLPYFENQTKT